MSTTRWMGAASIIDDQAPLTHRLDQIFSASQDDQIASCCFADAQPLTVRVRGVSLVGSYEWRPADKPDLMVVTVHNFGSEPLATRLHFMQDNVDLGWHGDFFEDTVVAMRDFKASTKQRLTLRIQVYDMDRFDADLVKGVTQVASSVAVTFPALAPYAAGISFGAPVLMTLIENVEQHDRIIDDRTILEVSKPGTGHNLLQPGYFVCFADPIDEDRSLYLTSNLRVVQTDPSDPAKAQAFAECSYAVLEVQKEFSAGHDWEIDQKINKLISELNGKGQSGRAALDFLRDTMDTYDRYRRLQRARELQLRQRKAQGLAARLSTADLSAEAKQGLEAEFKAASLSADESRLLEAYAKDENLAPFLLPVTI